VLAVVPRADDLQRARLVQELGLRDPVVAGGGWDPSTSRLEVVEVATAQARRRTLAAVVRRSGPGLVVVPDRERADRVTAGLRVDGLRASLWAPPPLRASRAAEAVADWRSRRLDALVVPAGVLPPLGRARLRLLVGAGVAGAEPWRDLVAELAPETAVLLADPSSPEQVRALAAAAGCRRAALLAPYGEPVVVPCGRCDVCAPAPV
jgi:superfamily II DNA helicase RecQ